MPASNIKAVQLLTGGKVTISGEFTDIKDYDVTLLHVWLAQPGMPGQPGVGLAIDCKNDPSAQFRGDTFTLTNTGINGGQFTAGPATVSAIAVLSPKPSSPSGTVAEVIQWERTLTLSQDQKHVELTTFTAGGGASS